MTNRTTRHMLDHVPGATPLDLQVRKRLIDA
jgi:hypothetical protein